MHLATESAECYCYCLSYLFCCFESRQFRYLQDFVRLGKDVLKWNVSKKFEPRRVEKFSARQPRKKLRRAQENSGARAAAVQSSMDLGAGQSSF